MPPVAPSHLSEADDGIMKNADAENHEPSFSGQHVIERRNRVGEPVPRRKDPTGQDGDESVEGRRGHHESKPVGKFHKKRRL